MLSIKGVSKYYAGNKIPAVFGLDLLLEKGEIFGFLGTNGAGKTTTIKMACGVLEISSGDIFIDGVSIKANPIEAKRLIGFVPDSQPVYDKLTGREYIDFLADIYGVSKQDRQQRSSKLLELFSLTSAFDAAISTYSHGMKQKIAIIGALIHDPKLLILDEPMIGLDPPSAAELKKLMRQHTQNGGTVFFSTHVLEVAEKICDRVGIISKGKLVLCGNVDELLSKKEDSSLEEIFLSVSEKSALNAADSNPNEKSQNKNSGTYFNSENASLPQKDEFYASKTAPKNENEKNQ